MELYCSTTAQGHTGCVPGRVRLGVERLVLHSERIALVVPAVLSTQRTPQSTNHLRGTRRDIQHATCHVQHAQRAASPQLMKRLLRPVRDAAWKMQRAEYKMAATIYTRDIGTNHRDKGTNHRDKGTNHRVESGGDGCCGLCAGRKRGRERAVRLGKLGDRCTRLPAKPS